ncbi:poly(A)-polymerase small subunit VP39 PAPS [Carp edema virus]|nr:poly(A)-polymerase small subunit VP39 PAPS [Carp edema virus]
MELTRPILKFSDITKQIKYEKFMETAEFPHNIKGQLKLFLSEILFFDYISFQKIVKNSKKKILIIYAGSSPGTHIKTIIKLFHSPKILWYLIDPRKTQVRFQDMTNIRIELGYATKDWAKEIKKNYPDNLYDIILISDIRTVDEGKEVSTKNLMEDYVIQDGLVQELKPIWSSLKWRCPFPDDWHHDFNIYKGEEFLQAFANKTSAEIRLFVSSKNTREEKKIITQKDAVEYEEKMAYYNHVLRKTPILGFNKKFPYHDYLYLTELISKLNRISFRKPTKLKGQLDIEELTLIWEDYIFEELRLKNYLDP